MMGAPKGDEGRLAKMRRAPETVGVGCSIRVAMAGDEDC
jgi:hypothetical protein